MAWYLPLSWFLSLKSDSSNHSRSLSLKETPRQTAATTTQRTSDRRRIAAGDDMFVAMSGRTSWGPVKQPRWCLIAPSFWVYIGLPHRRLHSDSSINKCMKMWRWPTARSASQVSCYLMSLLALFDVNWNTTTPVCNYFIIYCKLARSFKTLK